MLGCRGAAAQEMQAPRVTDFWRLLKFGWHLSIGHALFILYAIVGFRCVPRYYNRSVGHALFSYYPKLIRRVAFLRHHHLGPREGD